MTDTDPHNSATTARRATLAVVQLVESLGADGAMEVSGGDADTALS